MTGQELRRKRKAKGLTQEDLARLIGVARTTIIAYEKDGDIPEAKAGLLGRVLELSSEELAQVKTHPTMAAEDVARYVSAHKEELLTNELFREVIDGIAKDRVIEILSQRLGK